MKTCNIVVPNVVAGVNSMAFMVDLVTLVTDLVISATLDIIMEVLVAWDWGWD
ncbi:MAG: hypothetical protein ABFC84_17690 [Veillonellales bacterium]